MAKDKPKTKRPYTKVRLVPQDWLKGYRKWKARK